VIPHLVIGKKQANEAIEFYKKAFLAKELARHPHTDGKQVMHGVLEINGGHLYLCDNIMGKPDPCCSSATLNLNVEDTDEAADRAIAAGATVTMKVDNQPWGARYGIVTDPYGHVWSFHGPVKKSEGDEKKEDSEEDAGKGKKSSKKGSKKGSKKSSKKGKKKAAGGKRKRKAKKEDDGDEDGDE